MAITTFNDSSTTAASNIDVNGTSIQGTAPVSNFDNALRELMAIYRRDLDNGVVASTKSANYTALANDNNAILRFTGAYTLSLTAAATLGSRWHIMVAADGGDVVIDPNGAETINGAATITIPNGFSTTVWCTGSAFLATEDYATTVAVFSGRNLIINGQGRVNQRGYVSGAATVGANQYTLDRWRVVTTGQALTFTGDNSRRVMTAPAGGVEQIIEDINVEGGTYIINWTGTASCTVNGASVAKGATFTLTAASTATVKFSGGTFTDVQLEPGNVATKFERRSYAAELSECQRYWWQWAGGSTVRLCLCYADTTTTVHATLSLPVPMRTVSTISATNLTANGTAISAVSIPNLSGTLASLLFTTTGRTVNTMYQVYSAAGTTGTLVIDGEYL